MKITVLMPCLDEARTLQSAIEEAREGVRLAGFSACEVEILIADNGSVDGSVEIARGAGVRVVSVAPRGYGAALRGGIAAATGNLIVMADPDGSYDFREIPLFVQKLNEGFDVVIGNRFKGKIHPKAMPALNRYFGIPFLSLTGRILFQPGTGDFHSGIRAGTREALLSLGCTSSGMEFASEMIVRAQKLGKKIAEVPVSLRPDQRGRASHLRPFRDGFRHLRLLFSERLSR